MQELMLALLLWLGAHTNYRVDVPLPRVEYRSVENLRELYYGKQAAEKDLRSPSAFYDKDTKTVSLRTGFDPTNLSDQGSLLHEFVHHLQTVHNKEFRCSGQQEFEAYQLERKWLEERGAKHFARDELEDIMFLASCFYGE